MMTIFLITVLALYLKHLKDQLGFLVIIKLCGDFFFFLFFFYM